MSSKHMTVGRKVGLGFGVVLVILASLAVLVFTGVGAIVDKAHKVIVSNRLDGFLTQMEVDHLRWVNGINNYLTDDTISKLDSNLDDHSCALGKWLYGEERKEAERLFPNLAPLLKEIEVSHRKFHESAAKIVSVFRRPHTGLRQMLAEQENVTNRFVESVAQALAVEAGGLASYQSRLRNAVQEAVSILKACDENENLGTLEERQACSLKMIQSLRYGQDGKDYFWINDTGPRMIMHPYKPDLNGTDLSEFTDPKGKKFFDDFVSVCQANGSGFVTYEWPYYAEDRLVPKISYVQLYAPWNWIVGTGVYLDPTDKALLARADAFAQGKPFSLGVQLDPTQCSLSRFFSNSDIQKISAEFPELKQALDAAREPHRLMHDAAARIEKLVSELRIEEAIALFQKEMMPAADDLNQTFRDAIYAEAQLKDAAAQANTIFFIETKPGMQKTSDLLHKIRTTITESSVTDEAMLEAAVSTKRNVALVAGGALFLGILLAFLIPRGITLVLQKVSLQMDEAADQVASASDQVSSASQSLAEGASQQAAALEETSSSLEEMAAMTKQNAQNASQANQLMVETLRTVEDANGLMRELITSMAELSEASGETKRIIKTIDEIAFQTNLLALNAAVEAARAGGAGAGFAVVADEVRNLAMRAAQAAGDTTSLIEDTVNRIEAGTRLVGKASDSFTLATTSTNKVKELLAEIAAASSEQAQGVEQINRSVGEMDKVTQQNAATAEESAAASEQLNTQAEQLRHVLGSLLALVGGNGHTDVPAATAPPDAPELSAPAPTEPPALPVRKRAVKESEKAQLPETRTPEQIIPFEDEDFRDF